MFKTGQIIGSYTLVKSLGRGGFGEVWLADWETKFATTKVAVKLPLDEQVDHTLIEQEAQLWARASGHTNVLPIIEANEYDGQIVIVSEYAPDGSLEQVLKNNGGKLSTQQAVELIIGVLNGLEFLHSKQIIHRDLKPANILFQGKTPRLADFGISRSMRTTMASRSQHISGTFAYMSPEALDGKRTVQTDIWSVGVNLYQLISGKLPFPQKEPSMLFPAIIMREPEPLPDFVPPELKEIIAKTLEKNPENRYQDSGEVMEDLRKFLQPDYSTAPEKNTSESPPPEISTKVIETDIPKTEASPIAIETDIPKTEASPTAFIPIDTNSESVETKVKAPVESVETTMRVPFENQKESTKVSYPQKNKRLVYIVPIVLVLFFISVGGVYWLSTGLISETPSSAEDAMIKGIAATVNGESILLSDIEKNIKQRYNGEESKFSQIKLQEIRLQILDEHIENEVLFQKAESENLIPTDSEITKELNELMKSSGQSEEEFNREMKEHGETEKTAREEIKKILSINKLLGKAIPEMKPPTDSEIEEYYINNKSSIIKERGGKDSKIDNLEVRQEIEDTLYSKKYKLVISKYKEKQVNEAKIINYLKMNIDLKKR
jgi:serine/threonine protein kinase